MLNLFKTRRSAGVPVTPAVHRILARANAARDRRSWPEAAAAYRQALAKDGALAHIWVQLGNMLKEANDYPAAAEAYDRAFALHSRDPEPMLQLGHLHRRAKDLPAASRCFERAFSVAPASAAAAAGLRRALAFAPSQPGRDRLAALLLGAPPAPVPTQPPPTQPPPTHPRTLYIDLGDLLEFWSDGRLPTGIQRVQTQLLLHALAQPGTPVRLCAFFPGIDAFRAIDPHLAAAAATLSLQDRDPEAPAWVACLNRLHAAAALAAPLACRPADVLLGVGSSWNMPGYFPALAALRRRTGIAYLPLVYDLTPIVVPHFFTPEARADFVAWLPEMLRHATAAIAISRSTRQDLVAVAATLGHQLDPASVAVLPLDVDTRLATPPLPRSALARWQLAQAPFVLFVATLEPRKGHAVALDAWSSLLATQGPEATPTLVCVGKRGWLTAEIDRRIAESPALAAKVLFPGPLGEPELDLLYRSCLFTIYPSFYEGWGLPVTEALCHGKLVVTTSASALPEAGADVALYVDPGDPAALAATTARLVSDPALRARLEARIASEHQATTWDVMALRLCEIAFQLAPQQAGKEDFP